MFPPALADTVPPLPPPPAPHGWGLAPACTRGSWAGTAMAGWGRGGLRGQGGSCATGSPEQGIPHPLPWALLPRLPRLLHAGAEVAMPSIRALRRQPRRARGWLARTGVPWRLRRPWRRRRQRRRRYGHPSAPAAVTMGSWCRWRATPATAAGSSACATSVPSSLSARRSWQPRRPWGSRCPTLRLGQPQGPLPQAKALGWPPGRPVPPSRAATRGWRAPSLPAAAAKARHARDLRCLPAAHPSGTTVRACPQRLFPCPAIFPSSSSPHETLAAWAVCTCWFLRLQLPRKPFLLSLPLYFLSGHTYSACILSVHPARIFPFAWSAKRVMRLCSGRSNVLSLATHCKVEA